MMYFIYQKNAIKWQQHAGVYVKLKNMTDEAPTFMSPKEAWNIFSLCIRDTFLIDWSVGWFQTTSKLTFATFSRAAAQLRGSEPTLQRGPLKRRVNTSEQVSLHL